MKVNATFLPQTQIIARRNIQFWVYTFILVHVLCWTLIPTLIRYNLPLDTIEGTIWGHQLEWGYDKNPFLNGWLTALAAYLGGESGWLMYAFSQFSVAACLWVVWRLGQHMLSPALALIAVLLLEGLQYFNLHAIDFNDNTLELGLWALTIFYFYRALAPTRDKNKRPLNWVLTGTFAAFAMMAKYYTATLLASMALFLLLHRDSRRQLKTLPPYVGLIVFCMMITPHIVWLFHHDFITVQYVFVRASSEPLWSNHYHFPLQFAWEQLQVFIPALILYLVCFVGKNSSYQEPVTNFNKQFLYYVALGPFVLTLLLAVLFGIKLRAGWGMPLLSLWPLLLLIWIPPHVTKVRLYSCIAMSYILMSALMIGYSISLLRSDTPSSANFPGRELAQSITQQWHDLYHTKLNYVAGSRWLGGNIGFYSSDHPAVFIEWNNQRAPWIKVANLRRHGGVFIWDISGNETLPDAIKTQYPELEKQSVMEFEWKRNQYHLPPVKIGVAFLPPK